MIRTLTLSIGIQTLVIENVIDILVINVLTLVIGILTLVMGCSPTLVMPTLSLVLGIETLVMVTLTLVFWVYWLWLLVYRPL